MSEETEDARYFHLWAEVFLKKQKTQCIFISETDPVEPGEQDAQPPTPRLAEKAMEDGEVLQGLEEG